MANYITAAQVRFYTGLSLIDASDDDLVDFLSPATKAIIEQITAVREWEVLDGDMNDTSFWVAKYPIADTDGDKSVGTDEVTVYEWSDRNDPSTKTEVTVSSVVASEGKIVLASAPSSTAEVVTANYRYYQNAPDWDLVTQATAFYCGYLYTLTKWIWIPDTYRVGPVYLRNQTPVWDKFYKQYMRMLNLVQKRNYAVSNPLEKKSLDDMDKVVR